MDKTQVLMYSLRGEAGTWSGDAHCADDVGIRQHGDSYSPDADVCLLVAAGPASGLDGVALTAQAGRTGDCRPAEPFKRLHKYVVNVALRHEGEQGLLRCPRMERKLETRLHGQPEGLRRFDSLQADGAIPLRGEDRQQSSLAGRLG